MTQPPDYAGSPFHQPVHNAPARSYVWQSMSQEQLRVLREKLIEAIVQVVVQAVRGLFIPGGGLGGAVDQLQSWAAGVPVLEELVEALTGSLGDLTDLTAWANDIPILSEIVEALTGQLGGLELLSPLSWLFPGIIDNGDGTLTGFEDLFTDNNDGTWSFLPDGVHTVIDNGDGTIMSPANLLENILGQIGTYQDALDRQQGIIDSLYNAINYTDIFGSQLEAIVDALRSIPPLNVSGILGPANIGGSLGESVNNLVGGLVGAFGSDAGLADIFENAFQVSSWANLGQLSWGVLGIRTNKTLSRGMLPTSDTTVELPYSGASAPSFGVTSSTAITGFKRFAEGMSLGVIRWYGSGTTNITDFRVNLWKMDTSTGALSLVHSSANIVGELGTTIGVPTAHEIDPPIDVLPSEVYGTELEVRSGTGTHTVVGSQTWLGDDPHVFPRRLSAVRNPGGAAPPSTIASGSVSYASNIPVIEMGVELGMGGDSHQPSITTVTSTGTVPIPSWCNHIDAVTLGGGGGGRQGMTWGVSGEGGGAGVWDAETWDRGSDFDEFDTIINVTIGAGGVGGSGDGADGGTTTISIPGGQTVSSPGGEGGDEATGGGANSTGEGPGNASFNGVTYPGGGDQGTFGADGAAPGGGGGGGNYVSFQHGGDGAKGRAWLRFYQ